MPEPNMHLARKKKYIAKKKIKKNILNYHKKIHQYINSII